jgi:pimeloyl-ACP methyl ester carboxylesterase
VRAPARRAEWRAPLSPVASTDQVSIHLHDLGAVPGPGGDERPVLLCHATGFHGMVWQPLASHLTGYHAVAPDLRGQGDSSPPVGRPMDWAGFADDVLAVVDAWGVEDLVAVGHSKGGAALLLAEQRRPGTFRALWLYEPVVFPAGAFVSAAPTQPSLSSSTSAEPSNPLAEGALRRRYRFESRQAAYDNFSSKPPLCVLDPEALHAYVDHGFADQPDGTVALKCRPEVESAIFRMASDNGAFEHLGQVSCPVTIARGAEESFGPAAFAQPVVDALPRGRLVTFDHLGHFGPLERPAEVATAIVADLAP